MLTQCYFKRAVLAVEVFKTSVADGKQAQAMVHKLLNFMPHCRINFDLEDCDNVLRVEGINVIAEHVIAVLEESGFACEVLV